MGAAAFGSGGGPPRPPPRPCACSAVCAINDPTRNSVNRGHILFEIRYPMLVASLLFSGQALVNGLDKRIGSPWTSLRTVLRLIRFGRRCRFNLIECLFLLDHVR